MYIQGYTPAICETIHYAIIEDINRIRNRPAEPRAQVQRSDRCLNNHVVAASLGRSDRDCSLVFFEVGILLCSHFDSTGVDTPRAHHPALSCPVAMSAASSAASTSVDKGQQVRGTFPLPKTGRARKEDGGREIPPSLVLVEGLCFPRTVLLERK